MSLLISLYVLHYLKVFIFMVALQYCLQTYIFWLLCLILKSKLFHLNSKILSMPIQPILFGLTDLKLCNFSVFFCMSLTVRGIHVEWRAKKFEVFLQFTKRSESLAQTPAVIPLFYFLNRFMSAACCVAHTSFTQGK